jgi:hypothetical protein
MSSTRTFSWKAFISLYIVFSFVVLGLSGLVLYVAPPGRIANWSIWRLVLLSKAQWQGVHTIFAFVFLVAAGFHLYFNWKVLMAYLKSKLHEGLRMKWELGSASTAGFLLLTLTIGGVPPFSTVMDVGDDIKNAWTVPTDEPPIPHAEELTVDKLAETVKLPVEQARENLQKHGVTVEQPGMTVKQIAESNSLTPQQVYERIQSEDAKPVVAQAQGGGWGRKTVDAICRQLGVPVNSGLARLKAAGFETSASTLVKDLALAAGKTPSDIATIVAGTGVTMAAPAGHKPPAS